MKQPFNTLTKADVEELRRKSISVPCAGSGIYYSFTKSDVENAVKHLETLYTGIVRDSFAAKILLLNEIY